MFRSTRVTWMGDIAAGSVLLTCRLMLALVVERNELESLGEIARYHHWEMQRFAIQVQAQSLYFREYCSELGFRLPVVYFLVALELLVKQVYQLAALR